MKVGASLKRPSARIEGPEPRCVSTTTGCLQSPVGETPRLGRVLREDDPASVRVSFLLPFRAASGAVDPVAGADLEDFQGAANDGQVQPLVGEMRGHACRFSETQERPADRDAPGDEAPLLPRADSFQR